MEVAQNDSQINRTNELHKMIMEDKMMSHNRKCSKRTLSRLLAVALRMYLPLHLLLFGQSMRVLIAMGVKYLVLMKGKIYLIENQDDEMLGLLMFS